MGMCENPWRVRKQEENASREEGEDGKEIGNDGD